MQINKMLACYKKLQEIKVILQLIPYITGFYSNIFCNLLVRRSGCKTFLLSNDFGFVYFISLDNKNREIEEFRFIKIWFLEIWFPEYTLQNSMQQRRCFDYFIIFYIYFNCYCNWRKLLWFYNNISIKLGWC